MLLVAVQQWTFAGEVLDAIAGRTVATFRSELAWNKPVAARSPTGGQRPGAIGVAVACSRDAFVVWQRQTGPDDNVLKARDGLIEVRGYDGSLMLSRPFKDRDSLFLGRPLAAGTDLVFFRDNETGAFPRILVFQLSKEPRRAALP
jgi:hypothetical protein